VRQNKKVGYIDCEGVIRIPLEYEDGRDCEDGVIPVKRDGRWVLIDTNGQVLCEPRFDSLMRPGGGLCIVEKQISHKVYRYGLINYIGDLVVPCHYEEVSAVSCGRVSVGHKDRRLVLDCNGELVFEANQYDMMHNFKGNLAFVTIESDNSFVAGFINIDGRIVVPLEYGGGCHFRDGLIVVHRKSDGASRLIDVDHRTVYEPPPDSGWKMSEYSGGVISVDQQQDGKKFLIDIRGEILMPPQEEYTPFISWVSVASDPIPVLHEARDKQGYMTCHGDITIPCCYVDAAPFADDRAVVLAEVGGRDGFGLIDRSGEYVLPASGKNEDLLRCGEGVWRLKRTSGDVWYVNKEGDVIWGE